MPIPAQHLRFASVPGTVFAPSRAEPGRAKPGKQWRRVWRQYGSHLDDDTMRGDTKKQENNYGAGSFKDGPASDRGERRCYL